MIGKFEGKFQPDVDTPEIKSPIGTQGEIRVPTAGELKTKLQEAFKNAFQEDFDGRNVEATGSEISKDTYSDTVRLEDGTIVKLPDAERLTDEQKKEIKDRTGWPDEIIDGIDSMEEAEIYIKAGLKAVEINGKMCLIREDIDPDQVDEDGISNRERMERGRPPITKDGKEVELHHIGQKADSPLAELTMEEHRGVGNDTILHDKTKKSEIDRTGFGQERKEHWKDRANSKEEN